MGTKTFSMLIIVCITFFLAACGRGNETNNYETNGEIVKGENERLNLDENYNAGETNLTLTILAPNLYTPVIQEAERAWHCRLAKTGLNSALTITHIL